MKLFGIAPAAHAASEGGAFTSGGDAWRPRRAQEARAHAAKLFVQALTRLAQKHTGGSFHGGAGQATDARPDPGPAPLRQGLLPTRPQIRVDHAFLWWRRFAAIERDAEAQRLRLIEAATSGHDGETPRRIALERVTRRWARTCVDGSFEWWWHAARAFEKAAEAQQYRATLQIQRAFHVVGAEIGRRGIFVVAPRDLPRRRRWRALIARRNARSRSSSASRCGTCAGRWAGPGPSAASMAIEQQRRRGVHLFDVVLRRWATQSKAAAFVRMQREADIQRQLLASAGNAPRRGARDRYDSQKEAESAEALQALEARLVNEFAAERAAFERDAGERLEAERASLMSQHAAARRGARRGKGEERGAPRQPKRRGRERATERVARCRRTAPRRPTPAPPPRLALLYGDDLAELQGQLEDAQQALRDAPEPVDNQDELLALEAEASCPGAGHVAEYGRGLLLERARARGAKTAGEGVRSSRPRRPRRRL